MKFIHTADWQIGKPFAGIGDAHKRSLVQQERIEAIKRIGGVAQEHDAAFVLVAGDLFDSPSADKATVSAACSAIGQISRAAGHCPKLQSFRLCGLGRPSDVPVR